MFKEKKKWMSYTYYNRDPIFDWRTTHLYSPVWLKEGLNIRVPFPTMTVEVSEENFVRGWSDSTRTKINRAVREEMVADRGQNLLPDILKLFSFTAERKGLRGFTLSDFATLPKFECSAVMLDGVMLCGHVWLLDEDEKRGMLYINASNHKNENDDASLTGRAHYFLLWQDGLFLRKMGITTLDLQGYNPDTKDPGLKGVYTWKAGTHGQPEMLYHYYPFWFYLLRKLRNKVTR
jgi:hypothetical protein